MCASAYGHFNGKLASIARSDEGLFRIADIRFETASMRLLLGLSLREIAV